MNRKNLFSIVIIIVLTIATLYATLYLPFSYNNFWRFCADFKGYSGDFITVNDFVVSKYSEEVEKRFIVSSDEGHRSQLFDPDLKCYVDMPGDVLAAMKNIRAHGFPDKDSNLDTVSINGNSVRFGIENGHYALVYSPDGKPTWLNSPDEDIKIKVKRIGNGWYHVTLYQN